MRRHRNCIHGKVPYLAWWKWKYIWFPHLTHPSPLLGRKVGGEEQIRASDWGGQLRNTAAALGLAPPRRAQAREPGPDQTGPDKGVCWVTLPDQQTALIGTSETLINPGFIS
jgi:hypothetical protein